MLTKLYAKYVTCMISLNFRLRELLFSFFTILILWEMKMRLREVK